MKGIFELNEDMYGKIQLTSLGRHWKCSYLENCWPRCQHSHGTCPGSPSLGVKWGVSGPDLFTDSNVRILKASRYFTQSWALENRKGLGTFPVGWDQNGNPTHVRQWALPMVSWALPWEGTFCTPSHAGWKTKAAIVLAEPGGLISAGPSVGKSFELQIFFSPLSSLLSPYVYTCTQNFNATPFRSTVDEML